VWRKREWSGD